MHSLDFKIVIIKKGEIVEAMPSKINLMMPKNQELRKFLRFKNQISRIKIQEQSRSRFKNQKNS